MDTMKTTTTHDMLPHSAAPLPGYASLRYLLDALAKRAARAAGVPETAVCNPLRRDEYDAMTLPERAAMCRAAHLAFNDHKHPIPDPSPFDCINPVRHNSIGGNRYWIWYAAMGTLARERNGIAKLEIGRFEPFANLRMRLSILFYLEDDEGKAAADMPYVLTLGDRWIEAADVLRDTWPEVELMTPGQFDAMLVGWQSAQAQKAGQG